MCLPLKTPAVVSAHLIHSFLKVEFGYVGGAALNVYVQKDWFNSKLGSKVTSQSNFVATRCGALASNH